MLVFGTPSDKFIFEQLTHFDVSHRLNNQLMWQEIEKTNQKSLMAIALEQHCLMAIVKNTPQLLYYDSQSDELIKITLNWQALTKRIVSAGRKKELLLQACKLTASHKAIDATAGFGHDGLLLASTGAQVTFIEQNPIMALLLLFEHWQMSQQPNWQKLPGRISIYFGSATTVLPKLQKADVIYLDPMFPVGSYQAQVNKNMQLLHVLANVPTPQEEEQLLTIAQCQTNQAGKIVVKRSKNAPTFANTPPTHSMANDVIRFDVYVP